MHRNNAFLARLIFVLPAVAISMPLVCTAALGQALSIGVIGGTNLTNDVRSGQLTFPGGTIPSGETTSTTIITGPGARRPIIGLQLDYRLWRDWALEFDVLRRELKSTTTDIVSPPYVSPDGHVFSTFGPFTRTLTPWEFPLLVKYRLPLQRLRPFIAAGPSFRPAGTGTGLSHAGVTAGGGVEFLSGGFRITPTLRYTRWAADAGIIGTPLANQVEFLVGLDRPSPLLGIHAFGQRLSFGLIAGIAIGADFKVGSFNPNEKSEANSGIYGVMIEGSLPRNFAVEADGLYRPLHGSDLEFDRRVRFAHLTWEFPVLLKYRFSGKSRLRPLVEGGPSFRAEGNLNLQPVSHYGLTLGAGLEAKLSWLKVSPMVRYTRWSGAASSVISQARQNQVQLLVSVAF